MEDTKKMWPPKHKMDTFFMNLRECYSMRRASLVCIRLSPSAQKKLDTHPDS